MWQFIGGFFCIPIIIGFMGLYYWIFNSNLTNDPAFIGGTILGGLFLIATIVVVGMMTTYR